MQETEMAVFEPTPFDERIAAANKASTAPPPMPPSAPKQVLEPIPIGPDGMQLTSYDQVVRIARLLHLSKLAPSGFRTPEQLMVALLRALELGLPPLQAIEGMTVINNRVGLMGDLALSMVEKSGLLERKRVKYTGEGDELVCAVTLQRRGREAQTYSFSVKEARAAGIYERSAVWRQYPRRMTYYRALGFALRDEFSDVLKGTKTAEELQDYPVTDAAVFAPKEKPEKKNANSVEPTDEEL